MNPGRACTCGQTSTGVPQPELLADGWTVWHLSTTYVTCPECTQEIETLECFVKTHDKTRAELNKILTSEGLEKLDAAQADLEHRVLFGDES